MISLDQESLDIYKYLIKDFKDVVSNSIGHDRRETLICVTVFLNNKSNVFFLYVVVVRHVRRYLNYIVTSQCPIFYVLSAAGQPRPWQLTCWVYSGHLLCLNTSSTTLIGCTSVHYYQQELNSRHSYPNWSGLKIVSRRASNKNQNRFKNHFLLLSITLQSSWLQL